MGIKEVFKDIGAALGAKDDDPTDHPTTIKGDPEVEVRPVPPAATSGAPVNAGTDPDMVSAVNAAKARATTPRDLSGDTPGKVIGVADAAMRPKGL